MAFSLNFRVASALEFVTYLGKLLLCARLRLELVEKFSPLSKGAWFFQLGTWSCREAVSGKKLAFMVTFVVTFGKTKVSERISLVNRLLIF